MSKDYREILSGKVEEVKEDVDDLDDPDFEKLLKLEREGKDRKTVKEYLEKLREEAEDAVEDAQEEAEETAEEVEEEIDEASEDFMEKLRRVNPVGLLGAGLIVGILLGGVAGAALMDFQGSYAESPSAVKSDMQSLLSGPNSTVDVGPAMKRHGMYYFNVSTTQQTPNGTSTQFREFYVTSDGEMLFPKLEIPILGLRVPVNLQDAVEQRAAQQANQTR